LLIAFAWKSKPNARKIDGRAGAGLIRSQV
jgi:hypothetical protein